MRTAIREPVATLALAQDLDSLAVVGLRDSGTVQALFGAIGIPVERAPNSMIFRRIPVVGRPGRANCAHARGNGDRDGNAG